jgi:tRNA-2-methylthio-N6-dimethylallyladenosine synthase
LRGRGYAIVDSERSADIVLLNTCSVRDQAEQKAIGKAGYLAARKRRQPDFVLGVMGCMAQNRGTDLLDRLPDLDLLVGTQKFHQVPDHLDHIMATLRGQGPRPSTIVDLESEAGTREVTLLGQIVTSYGQGEFSVRDGRSPFVQLLERVHEIPGIARIRFTSPHPRGFKRDLVEAFRTLPKLCPAVHLPLQSGSNRILRAMNRPYTRELYLQIIDDLRGAVPDMYFSTDIIVGFPGESEEDFAQTCDVFERVNFDMAFIFRYSIRTGTPAAELADQLSDAEKERRNQELLARLERQSRRRNEALVGTVQEVLVEGPDKKGLRYMGRTPGNRITHFAGHDRLVGELVPVRIERASVSSLVGEVI